MRLATISSIYYTIPKNGLYYMKGNGTTSFATISSGFALGSNDFTVEVFYYYTYTGAEQGIAATNTQGGGNGFNLSIDSTNHLFLGCSGFGRVTSTTTLASNTWYHLAATRTGSTGGIKLYINGTNLGSGTIAFSATNGICVIGKNTTNVNNPSATFMNGYLYQLRITSSLVYTGNFTSPVTALTNIPNCILLAQVNSTGTAIIDNSVPSKTITNSGLLLTKFSPNVFP
jgi:hypothetical protein